MQQPVYPTFVKMPDEGSPTKRVPRCRMVLAGASGEYLTDEQTAWLRKRLRIVSLIAFIPFAYFLAAHQLYRSMAPESYGMFELLVQGLVVVVLGGITLILWGRRPLSGCMVRRLEVALFGSIATYFAWLQFCGLSSAEFLSWAAPDPTSRTRVLNLVTYASTMRWFFLIVLYGVFVPNTWRRCTSMIAIAVVLCLAISLVTLISHEQIRGELVLPLVNMTILLLAASAIAIFGSSRLYSLQQEARQARQLGQYRLVKTIGAGGMGEVYLAEHTLLRRPCAVKLIRRDQATDELTLSRFEREVQAMATLTHWGTVEILDYGHAEDGTFYYVMEYLPGLNLESLVEKGGPLPPGRVVHLLRQICPPLREAHQRNLLHRDIKPGNLIACERGGIHDVVKLLDFGLVQNLNLDQNKQITIQGTILGSPPFMSPEQARGRNDLTPASDIYSLGCVAYYLLTGQPPFVKDTVMELLIAHATEPLKPLRELHPGIPGDLEAVIHRCLAKKPEERFRSVDELDKALSLCSCAGEWTEADAREWWESCEIPLPDDSRLPTEKAQALTTSMESSSVESLQ